MRKKQYARNDRCVHSRLLLLYRSDKRPWIGSTAHRIKRKVVHCSGKSDRSALLGRRLQLGQQVQCLLPLAGLAATAWYIYPVQELTRSDGTSVLVRVSCAVNENIEQSAADVAAVSLAYETTKSRGKRSPVRATATRSGGVGTTKGYQRRLWYHIA